MAEIIGEIKVNLNDLLEASKVVEGLDEDKIRKLWIESSVS